MLYQIKLYTKVCWYYGKKIWWTPKSLDRFVGEFLCSYCAKYYAYCITRTEKKVGGGGEHEKSEKSLNEEFG